MSALARWCARWRGLVVGVWVVALLGLGIAAIGVGADYSDASSMPNSESATATALLGQLDAGKADGGDTGTIVWQSSDASVTSDAVQDHVVAVLDRIAAMPGVVSVSSPYDARAPGQVDLDRNVAYATVTFSTGGGDASTVADVARTLQDDGLQVEIGGQAFTERPSAGGATEIIGILGALVVLILVFRSVWAALLPIVTGVAGVMTSLFIVMLASNVVTLSSSTPTMGALIGLGVGIDYALFIVNRYRKAILAGESVDDAIVQAIDTSGRAVIFAGGTVVIALLGMFVVQIDILTGMARGAAVTVLLTVAAALTLLPALLATLGHRVLSRSQRRALAEGKAPVQAKQSVASGWANFVSRCPRSVALAGIVVMLIVAIPALSLRLGSADASSDPTGSDSYRFNSMMATSFGAGFDAPLLVVAKTPDAASVSAFDQLVTQIEGTSGVASVSTTPAPEGAEVSVATVTPTTSAQADETADLVNHLRDDVIPAAEAGTRMDVYVGGSTASNIDNAAATLSKLPLYLVLIAVLGFILLVIAFRSILVPLLGAIGNLLTAAVALGAVTAVFKLGWGTSLLGVGSAAPIESIVPVAVIGVMFGLSMDYQVFLVSRIHEEWTHTRDNAHAIRVGMRETGQVIVAAAVIMLCVFGSFAFAGQRIIAEIGTGMAIAVFLDAFVVRMGIVPGLMHVLGRWNWAYPRWADRITPHLTVEGARVSESEWGTWAGDGAEHVHDGGSSVVGVDPPRGRSDG